MSDADTDVIQIDNAEFKKDHCADDLIVIQNSHTTTSISQSAVNLLSSNINLLGHKIKKIPDKLERPQIVKIPEQVPLSKRKFHEFIAICIGTTDSSTYFYCFDRSS
jgi:hypothetical protein